MTEWWEEPYKGGPMAMPASMFPRPLYPPDAATKGKTPSKNGPDVEAYKRCVWHAGRWPGPASEFDRAFSNGFSHGQGGNVGNSGIAGFQRQMNIEDTGWIGPSTFNTLASARIPEGRDNEGDPIMDPLSCEMIAEAFEIYGGDPNPEPEPPPNPKGRDLLAGHFNKRNGYTEQPAGSNFDQRQDGIKRAQRITAGVAMETSRGWLDRQPWCGCWAFYALDTAGVTGLGSWMASVAMIEDRARKKLSPFTGWTTDRSKVKLGDLVVIGGRGIHVETVRGISGSNTLTWGGNTSSGSIGSQANGGGAFQRTRTPAEVYGYALVRYPGE